MSEEVVLTTATGNLFGTLELPPESYLVPPVALIWGGAGPTDRDGNSHLGIRARCLRLLAEDLAESGIASLRVDKRGVADSMAAGLDEEALTLQSHAEDAALWIDRLKADERFGKVILMGHGEGAGIVILAATLRSVDGVVSLAGPGRPAGELLREQLARQANSGNVPAGLHQLAGRYVDKLEQGLRIENLDPRLATTFRSSIQPFLISLLRFNPAMAVGSLAVPFLVVQGGADDQVSMADADALAGGCPQSRRLNIPEMNHLLKVASSQQHTRVAQLLDPSQPLAGGLVQGIAGFIGELGGTAAPAQMKRRASLAFGGGKSG